MIIAPGNMSNVDLSSQTTYEPESKHIQYYSSSSAAISTFTFNQQAFMLEKNVAFELHEPLKCQYTTTFIEIPALGLHISTKDIGSLDKKICKHVLTLYSKAQNGSLSADENESWQKIVDNINYQKLAHEYSRPYYSEATVLKKDANTIHIQWHDGEKESLSTSKFKVLDLLDEDEMFGAFVKQDIHGHTTLIETLSLVEKTDADISSIPFAELEAL